MTNKMQLHKGERVYISMVKLNFDKGRVRVKPGEEEILGPADEAAGVRIDLLLKNGAIVPKKGGQHGKGSGGNV